MNPRKGAKRMGTFKIDIALSNPIQKTTHWKLFRGVLVDTGSESTWLPEEGLASRSGLFMTVDEVVFAKPGDLSILGARTLEGFNAVVDPRHKKLLASGPLPAAAA